MKRAIGVILSCLVAVQISGCATAMLHADSNALGYDACNEFPSYVYGGTLTDAGLIIEGIGYIPESPISGTLMSAFGLADISLSFTADSIVMPVAVYRQFVSCKNKKKGTLTTGASE